MNEGTLNGLVTGLMDHLKAELQQYGEILALLEQQQESVVTRSAEDVMQSVADINHQMARVQEARQKREACQNTIAKSLHQQEDPTFITLLPHLPEKFRSAVGTLVRDNNELLHRVHRRARQNHLLLARSLEMMQQFLTALAPATPPMTYNESGRLHGQGATPQNLYEAVG
jgi:flagellar biosynthesis/type III secretory pathway chaperone